MTRLVGALRGFLAAVVLAGLTAWGATPTETRSYEALLKLFHDGLYETADLDAGSFLSQFPESEKVAEVVLLQAQARMKLKRYAEAAALLAARREVAGKLGDEFAFWQAEAAFEKGDLSAAADGFARVARDFPKSNRRLEASYNAAYCRFSLGDTNRAVALLSEPGGAFQQAAKAHPTDAWTTRGWLLLGEALLRARDQTAAANALNQITNRNLNPELAWQGHFLRAKIDLAAARLPEALAQATNLWTSATNTIRPDLLADAVTVQGQILESLGRPEAAREVYARNLAEGVPALPHSRAVQKTVELSLKLDTPAQNVTRLEGLLKTHPQDPAFDLVRLTLGQLRLQEYYAQRAKAEPLTAEAQAGLAQRLAQARAQFDAIATNTPTSPLLGQAQLGRGWCLWEETPPRLPESLLAFQAAAAHLPGSLDQVIARFKAADCQFRLKDYTEALGNYWWVGTNALLATQPTNLLSRQALYQVARTGIAATNLAAAEFALRQLLERDPSGELADRAELLVGQAFNHQGKPEAARLLLDDFVQRFTNSTLLPQVKLAVAKTFEQEQAWQAAITQYQNWLTAYASNPVVPAALTAQASFELARLSYQVRPDTNSLTLMTNFVARFPHDANAPLAQYLAGDYFWNQGDYERAELHYQDRALLAGADASHATLGYEARLMAARAAVAGQRPRNALEYLDWLITNGPLSVATSPIPVPIVAQAYLLRGDVLAAQKADGSTNTLARFGEAIIAFSKITEGFPTNECTPRAWGRIGDCNLQLAAQDPAQAAKRYELAADAYTKALQSPLAEVAVRSQAELGLGIVAEKEAALRPAPEQGPLLDRAFDHYHRVFYGLNLRDGEQPDPYWLNRAGLAAAALAESRKQWDAAIGLYRRLQTELPSLHERLQRRIEEALQARGTTGGK